VVTSKERKESPFRLCDVIEDWRSLEAEATAVVMSILCNKGEAVEAAFVMCNGW